MRNFYGGFWKRQYEYWHDWGAGDDCRKIECFVQLLESVL